MNKPRSGRLAAPSTLFLLFAILMLNTCASGRKTATGNLGDRSADFLMRQLITQQVQADWLSAKAKVRFDDGYVSMGATANIEMQKDSLVWVAVRKLGFEVGRALITPDSIYVIDRLNNEYTVQGLDFLAEEYQVPADFNTLQAILLGNPLFFMTRGFEVEAEEPLYHLFGKEGTTESHYWLESPDFQLRRMAFNDLRESRRLQIHLGEYDVTDEKKKFSYLRNLEMDSRETGKMSIGIEFSQVEFNIPKRIRFEIPDRYTRVD